MTGTGGGYDWHSAQAGRFLQAAAALVIDGVPIWWLTRRLYEVEGHRVGGSVLRNRISAHMGGSPHGRGLRHRADNPARGRRGRQRRTPDAARCPAGTRRLTGTEWAHLLRLHAQIRPGGGHRISQTPAQRERRRAERLARDCEILRLWCDRVSIPHLADVLGLSEGGIERARRAAKLTGAPAVKRPPAGKPPPRRTRPGTLTDTERNLLAAAFERATTPGPGRIDGRRALQVLIERHRARDMTLTALAAALGVSPGRLRTTRRATPAVPAGPR